MVATVGRRNTQQRRLVAKALVQQPEFVSAQSLHAALRSTGESIGLATVYRTLQHLAEEGAVDVIRTTSGESMYRQCGSEHHHHLVCRECGRTVEVVGPAVERWSDKVAAENGFVEIEHTLEIVGLCSACHRARG